MDKRKEANLRVKNNIVRALIDLMKEKPYEEISISEIALQAGVSRVSYYRNYGSKEDILTETLKTLMARFSEEISAMPLHTPVRRIMTGLPGKTRPFSVSFIKQVWTVSFRKALTASSSPPAIFQRWTDGEPIRPIYFQEPFSVSSSNGMQRA